MSVDLESERQAKNQRLREQADAGRGAAQLLDSPEVNALLHTMHAENKSALRDVSMADAEALRAAVSEWRATEAFAGRLAAKVQAGVDADKELSGRVADGKATGR